jgi:hypothetical protein
MKTINLLLPLCAAGCADGGAPPPIPGAQVLTIGAGPVGALTAHGPLPCGYQLLYDEASNGQTRIHHDWSVTITYDAAGHEVAETGVDASNAVVLQYSTEYDAMGNVVERTQHEADATDTTQWAVYDSFGRVVRMSTDVTGDGIEDLIDTYTYLDDGNLWSIHAIDPFDGNYDLHYLRFPSPPYRVSLESKDDGSVPGLSQFNVPPNSIAGEVSEAWLYDDVTRVAEWHKAWPVFDPDFLVGTGQKVYDDGNQLLSFDWSDRSLPGYSKVTHTENHTYRDSTEVSFTVDEEKDRASGEVVTTSKKIAWKYSGCQ